MSLTLFVKQYTGRSIVLRADPGDAMDDVLMKAFDKRANKECQLEDWAQQLSFLGPGARRLDLAGTVASNRLCDNATITECLRRTATAYNTDFATLRTTDPVTQERCEKPRWLPCGHVLERGHPLVACPVCRADIPPGY